MLVVENIEDQNIKKKKKVNQVYMYIHIHTINVFYIMNCTIIDNYYKCSLITISHHNNNSCISIYVNEYKSRLYFKIIS